MEEVIRYNEVQRKTSICKGIGGEHTTDRRLIGIPERYYHSYHRYDEQICVPDKWVLIGADSGNGDGVIHEIYEMRGVYWNKDGVRVG